MALPTVAGTASSEGSMRVLQYPHPQGHPSSGTPPPQGHPSPGTPPPQGPIRTTGRAVTRHQVRDLSPTSLRAGPRWDAPISGEACGTESIANQNQKPLHEPRNHIHLAHFCLPGASPGPGTERAPDGAN